MYASCDWMSTECTEILENSTNPGFRMEPYDGTTNPRWLKITIKLVNYLQFIMNIDISIRGTPAAIALAVVFLLRFLPQNICCYVLTSSVF